MDDAQAARSSCHVTASGHGLHWIPAFQVIRAPEERVPVRVEVDGDRVVLHGAGDDQPRYTCDLAQLASLIEHLGDEAMLDPRFGVLIYEIERGAKFVSLSRRPIVPCHQARSSGATIAVEPGDDVQSISARLVAVIEDLRAAGEVES